MMQDYLYWVCFICISFYLLLDREKLGLMPKYALYVPLLFLLSFTMAVTVEQFDIGTYNGIYDRLDAAPDEWAADMFPEWGYQYINYIANGVLGWSFEQFRFVYAFFVLTVVFFSISRLTHNHGLFFILYYPKYFLIGLISHSRSGFVNAFIFFAIDLAARGRYLRLLMMSLVLTQIHFSAILLNLLSILSKFKLRLLYVLLCVPAGVVFSKILFPYMIEILGIIDLRQLNYLVFEGEVGSMFGIEFVRRTALIGVCAYLVFYDKITDEVESLTVKFFILSVFVYLGFHEARFIADRVGGMLGFVEPFLWIVFLQNHIFKANKLMAFVVVFGYACTDFLLRAIYLDSLPGHLPISEMLNGVLW
jgi:hypothetical protein